tara:strand:+ start:74 stop:607 length:534 start_codon:yes stop_codon:yes gene_type:complete
MTEYLSYFIIYALTMLSGVVNASVPFYQGNVLTQTLAAATTLARSGSSSSSSSGGGEAQQIGTVVIPVVVAIKALVIATLSQIVIENVQQQVDAAGQVEIRHVLGNALFNAMLSQDQSYMDSATNDQVSRLLALADASPPPATHTHIFHPRTYTTVLAHAHAHAHTHTRIEPGAEAI